MINQRKTKEEHRKLIGSKKYNFLQWRKAYTEKYKNEGYYHDPHVKFCEPWLYFKGNGNNKYKTKEEHRELISSKKYTIPQWRKAYTEKYKNEGYYSDPYVKFGEPWLYFKRNGNNQYKTKEEHRELISYKKYNFLQWRKAYKEKYKNEGYYYNPCMGFNESWKYFKKKEKQNNEIE